VTKYKVVEFGKPVRGKIDRDTFKAPVEKLQHYSTRRKVISWASCHWTTAPSSCSPRPGIDRPNDTAR
jgi:hypothetical protein